MNQRLLYKLVSTSVLSFASLAVVVTTANASPPGPPPEAIAACASAKEGDTCTVKFGSDTLDGVCTKAGDVVACRPNKMPPPPRDRDGQ